MITPTSAVGHSALEQEVCDWLIASGFLVGCCAYHEALPNTVCRRLQQLNDPASLLIRTRSDRVVVHTSKPLVFFLEIKTGTMRAGQDFMPELVQIAGHRSDFANVGARSVYVYRNLVSGFESSFLVDEWMPAPTRILIGPQKEQLKAQSLVWAKPWWPHLGIQVCGLRNSGDPCLRIPERNLPRVAYKDFFNSLLHQQGNVA